MINTVRPELVEGRMELISGSHADCCFISL